MIRQALPSESHLLTEISHASKAYWGYSPENMEIFKRELVITESYIQNSTLWVYEKTGGVEAYLSLRFLEEDISYPMVTLKKGFWLDHMFVKPKSIGQGIGRILFQHLRTYLIQRNIDEIQILADPNSKAFYEKMGCTYKCEYPSSIKGRTTPYLVYNIIL